MFWFVTLTVDSATIMDYASHLAPPPAGAMPPPPAPPPGMGVPPMLSHNPALYSLYGASAASMAAAAANAAAASKFPFPISLVNQPSKWGVI